MGYPESTTPIARSLHEGRLKAYVLPARELIDVFNWFQAPVGSYLMVSQATLPHGATVDRVWYDDNRRSLVVVFIHPSFDPVPEGMEIPVEWNTGLLKVEKKTNL